MPFQTSLSVHYEELAIKPCSSLVRPSSILSLPIAIILHFLLVSTIHGEDHGACQHRNEPGAAGAPENRPTRFLRVGGCIPAPSYHKAAGCASGIRTVLILYECPVVGLYECTGLPNANRRLYECIGLANVKSLRRQRVPVETLEIRLGVDLGGIAWS